MNLCRIIYPVPMRIPPKLTFTDIPPGISALIGEESNLGFTVLFMPSSIQIDHFGWIANAEF